MRNNALTMTQKIRLGVSACLLGRKVRYDGGQKRDPFVADTLGSCVEYVPVCPETEAGLGVPREPMRLVGDPANPRLVTIDTGIDRTDMVRKWAERRVLELEAEGLCGFILKARSPSCGMEVEICAEGGQPPARGMGLFARALTERSPGLPVTDEDGLREAGPREGFIRHVLGRPCKPDLSS